MPLLIFLYRISLLIISRQILICLSQILFLWNCSLTCPKWYFCFAWWWSFHHTSSRPFGCFRYNWSQYFSLLIILVWFFISCFKFSNLLSSFFSGWPQIVVTSKFKSQPNLLEYGSHKVACWDLYSTLSTPLHSFL